MGLFDDLAKAITTPQEKANYSSLLSAAGISIPNLGCSLEKGVLSVTGTVPDGATAEAAVAALKKAPGVTEVKNYLVVEDLTSKNIKMKVVTKSSNLNIRKGPGTQFEIVGKAAHNSEVQLIKKMYNGWYYIKSANGVFGFCSTDYLAQI
ncbi:MAG: hypothetical protein H6Q21_2372 [Bacteroidetes bacterium]|nr:hypothetical protein [Bacteroidota bacterium]